jgi:hypothetical protein
MEAMTADEIRERLIALDQEKAKDVSRWEIKVGEDSLGEPAVFVTVVFRDDRAHAGWVSWTDYRHAIERRLRSLLPPYWPYVWPSAESVMTDPRRVPA